LTAKGFLVRNASVAKARLTAASAGTAPVVPRKHCHLLVTFAVYLFELSNFLGAEMRDEITRSNPCRDVWFDQLLRAHCSRRDLLKGSLSLALACLFPASSRSNAALAHSTLLGFSPVPVSVEDTVRVPEGYTASVLYRWGDPVGSALGSPSFREEAGNTAEEQALQAGMHHDGLHYFSLPYGSKNSRHGLLVS
jgi:Bacterial protein of unknown function (DUF839)